MSETRSGPPRLCFLVFLVVQTTSLIWTGLGTELFGLSRFNCMFKSDYTLYNAHQTHGVGNCRVNARDGHVTIWPLVHAQVSRGGACRRLVMRALTRNYM